MKTLHAPTCYQLLTAKQHADAFPGNCYFGNRVIWGVEPWLLEVRNRQRASGRAAPSLPVLIVGLAFGGIRQQQLSPHGLFPEFKVIGGENAIVLYPAIKTKQKKRKQEQWILNRLSDLVKKQT